MRAEATVTAFAVLTLSPFVLTAQTGPAGAPALALSPTQWTSIGSSPVWNGDAQYPWAGRIKAIAVHPANNSIMWVGGASGGVWKTTNAGQSWTPLTDTQPVLTTGSLALDPSNPNTIYVGTGEQILSGTTYIAPGDLYGAGILKSTDGGTTWTQYPGPFAGPFDSSPMDGGARIGSLAVSQADGRILLAAADFGQAAAQSGIYRSSDGGATWTLVLGGASGTEVLFDVSSGKVAYAALGSPAGSTLNGVYKSVDAGSTWTRMSGAGTNAIPAATGGRIRLAQAVSSPSTLYAAIARTIYDGDNALGVFKSTDGGANWSVLKAAPDYCGGACNYHEVIRVHPLDANTVVVGGVLPYLSTDGGATWQRMEFDGQGTQLHPDTQALAWTADGTRLYIGTDGGIHSPSNLAPTPNTWNNLNNGLTTTQFYPGMSIHPSNPSIAYAGSQDNGVQKYLGNPIWITQGCGDGGRTIIDPGDPNTVYMDCAGDQVYKITAASPVPVASGMQHGNERTQFLAPFVMDPNNSSRLYFGTYRVWVSNDGAASWNPISPDLTVLSRIMALNVISVAPADSNTIYAASGSIDTSRVWVSVNALAGAQSTWTNVTGSLPQRPPTQIAIDRADPKLAYIAFSGFSGFNGDTLGHVFRTGDRGETWTDISANLPNLPVNDLLLDPDMPSTLYAATDRGVYRTVDGGARWSLMGAGLPNAPVESLAIHRASRLLRAATFGRGAWDLGIPLPTPVPAQGGILNSATGTMGGLAAGSIATIYGSGLALEPAQADGAPLPTLLGGAMVTVDGFPAGIYYASPSQISFQVPWEVAGKTQVSVVVTSGGVASAPATIPLSAYAPGLYTTNQQGTGQAAARVAGTASIAAPVGVFPGSSPAPRGGYVEFYGTGFGPVSNTPADCAASPAVPLAYTNATVSATVGGLKASVSFSGLAPGLIGLYQIDVRIPAGVTPGNAVPVTLAVAGVASNTVTIAVQ